MRVGISLLTLVPGEVGGAETSARGLCRGLAEVGTLEYTAFTPPAAPGAGEGLREVPVPEYRLARSVPERALAMALAAVRPGRLRRRLGDARRAPLPAHGRAADARRTERRHASRPSAPRPSRALLAAPSGSSAARDARELGAERRRCVVPSQFVRRRVDRAARPPAGARARDPAGASTTSASAGGRGAGAVSRSIPPGRGRTRTTRGSSRLSRSCAGSGRSSSSC